jgi:Immunoglobulin I-set domain
MNKPIFRLSVLTMIVAMAQGLRLPVDMDNTIDGGQAITMNKDWVEVSRAPPARVAKYSGRSVELECEVIGQPTPSVRWVHGSAQSSTVSQARTLSTR